MFNCLRELKNIIEHFIENMWSVVHEYFKVDHPSESINIIDATNNQLRIIENPLS